MNTSSTFTATDGSGYELTMGRWSRRLAERFVDFTGASPAERVLDVGCGTGHLAAALLERAPQAEVHGVDIAPVYIDYARVHCPGAHFRVGDACALVGEPDAGYDRVLSLLLLHFVPRTEQAIAEMKRVAKPGGTVAAAVWDVRGGMVANRLFFDTAAALDAQAAERRARNYTRPMTRPGELAAAWRAAGFGDVSEATLAIRMEFACFADYWAPYEGHEGPGAEYVQSLGDEARARLRDAVQAAYLDGEPDGPRSYAALAWAVKGTA